jgi:hypothetical protein
LEFGPYQRLVLTVAALAVLGAGIDSHSMLLFFVSLIGCLAILYIAGGGRRPSKIGLRDSLLYIFISLVIVAFAILAGLYMARKAP